ncbi:hypothetical protein BJX99DRAFT_263956 [Aspergillus californicus]
MSSSKRMAVLLMANRTAEPPKIDGSYVGWYHAPNGERYFGVGTVSELGLTHGGDIYVRVLPDVHKPEDKDLRFFDPSTDKDMPGEQYPENRRHVVRRDQEARYNAHVDQLREKVQTGLNPGDVAFGSYDAVTRITYMGTGRVVMADIGQNGQAEGYFVEPISGGSQFWELYSDANMASAAMPRAPYTGSKETQANENPERPRREKISGDWYGRLPYPPDVEHQPCLDDECVGAYIAPDGQWYVGKGKVIALGITWEIPDVKVLHIYVEPIPGKSGGDYDFCHPVTREWMDELPSNPIPGVAYTPGQPASVPQPWADLPDIRSILDHGKEYKGRYCPPQAPKRNVYIGVGKVIKMGVNEEVQILVDVVPIPGKTGRDYMFFDPWTGQEMPKYYYPDKGL